MEFIEITMKVPKGYEKQIEDLVMTKIEGIISQAVLQPTAEKRAEFDTLVNKAYIQNGKVKKK